MVNKILASSLSSRHPLRIFRRCHWSGRIFQSSSSVALVDAVEAAIPRVVNHGNLNNPPPVILFSLSKHLPPNLLSRLVGKFQSLAPQAEPIGCLVEDPSVDRFSASIAEWKGIPSELVPFTSTIPPRAPVAVGREILPSFQLYDDTESSLDHEMVFSAAGEFASDRTANVSRSASQLQRLPEELKSLPPNLVQSLIFFSSPAPEPLLQALELAFPSAGMMGIIGSSTAFETGRQSTLFRGNWIGGDQGAVGVAVVGRSPVAKVRPDVSYEGMRSFGRPMRITKAQGNIVLSLDSQKAARCLLQAIEQSTTPNSQETAKLRPFLGSSGELSKEEEFYLGFLDPKDQKIVEVCKITGGSPTRGAMAIERERAIQVDECVQFIHFRPPTNSSTQSSFEQDQQQTLRFEFTCRKPASSNKTRSTAADEVVDVTENLFSCGSEYGFILETSVSCLRLSNFAKLVSRIKWSGRNLL